jgi:hypothetical protein
MRMAVCIFGWGQTIAVECISSKSEVGKILIKLVQDLNKDTFLHVVLLIIVERRIDTQVVEIVLHQPIVGGFMILVDVAPMLRHSLPLH